MDAMNWVAIVGAAAWAPQIVTWVCRTLTKPKVSLYLDSKPQIGYTTLGPIFNVKFALLSERKDAILNKFSVKLRHESGASYTFDWDGLSEDLSEIENPFGPIMSIKKTSLPLVVKVLHTGVAQVFVRFQHKQFKANSANVFASAADHFNLLKTSGKLRTEEDIEALVSHKEFNDVIKIFNSEFIWSAGEYTVTFEFKSPNAFKYTQSEYIFQLAQDDIGNLRKNIDNMKLAIIEAAKSSIIPDYKPPEILWEWRFPELEKK
ncbi:MAG: hypothetical protein ACYTEL_19270 [Planctomycetota bacterium]